MSRAVGVAASVEPDVLKIVRPDGRSTVETHFVLPKAAAGESSRAAVWREALADLRPAVVTISVGGADLHASRTHASFPLRPPGRAATAEDVLELEGLALRPPIEPDREIVAAYLRSWWADGALSGERPVGVEADRLEAKALVVTCPRALVRLDAAPIEALGHRVEWVPAGFALAQFALTADARTMGGIAIDFGDAATEIGVFADGAALDCSTLEWGWRDLVSELASVLKTDVREIERVLEALPSIDCDAVRSLELSLRQTGAAVPRPLPGALMADLVARRLAPVFAAVRSRLIRAAPWAALPAGVVLCGPIAVLPGVVELFARAVPELPVALANDAVNPHRLAYGAALAAMKGEEPSHSRRLGWAGRLHDILSRVGGR